MKTKYYGLNTLTRLHQFKAVDAGKSEIVWHLNIPKPYILFINALGNSWYPNTEYTLYIDGEKVEDIEREVAPINNPVRIDPPIVAFYEVKVIGTNNDKERHMLEFLIDGFLIEKPTY